MGAILETEISERINALLNGKTNIKLLEAGCGSASYFKFVPTVQSVGIDILQEQLDRNSAIQEKIHGDLQTYPLPEQEFDVVVCWDVIEHLSNPRSALTNMFNATKAGGFVILGFPHLASFKGMVTKFTPFWFHRYFYRAIMKYKSTPFRTYLRFSILPKRILKLAQESGFSVAYYRLTEGTATKKVRKEFRLVAALFYVVNLGARVVTLGKCDSLYLDGCALILKKGERQPASGLRRDRV